MNLKRRRSQDATVGTIIACFTLNLRKIFQETGNVSGEFCESGRAINIRDENVSEASRSDIRISVITVVRNGVEFIEQTICSVLEQTYSNLEYIVIDGFSSDGTVDVIKSHESRIAHWVSEKDNGIADAFNKGLALATGDYILFLNADDALATPHVLEKIATEIAGQNYPVLLYGDYDIIERDSGDLICHGRVVFSPKKLTHGQVLPHPCLFTGRSYFEKYGKFDTSFRIAMDYEWLLRGILKERVAHAPILTTNIRNGGVSTLDQPRTVEEIILALKKNGYFSRGFSEYKTRGYFFARMLSRKMLDKTGLYDAFWSARNKLGSFLNKRHRHG